jgi:hypothetical protein
MSREIGTSIMDDDYSDQLKRDEMGTACSMNYQVATDVNIGKAKSGTGANG